MPGRPLITVVTPVYREQDNVRLFYDRVAAVAKGAAFDLELLFVDDGSDDRTFDIIQEIAAADPRVHCLRFSRNFGSLAACNAGLRYAAGDAAVLMSADMQEPPELLFDFFRQWHEGADVVWAVRESRDDPFFKSRFAQLFYRLMRWLAFPDFPLGGMDTGLFDRRVVEVYCSIPERATSPFFTIFSLGFRQAFVPYHRNRREHGKSHWPFWKRVRNAVDILVSFTDLPVRLISVVGILLSLSAFIGAAVIIYQRLVLGMGDTGWPSLAVLVLFIGGMQMLLLGIAAEYIFRISQQVKSRPRYIIVEQLGVTRRPSGVNDHLDVNVSQTSDARPSVRTSSRSVRS